MKLTWVGLLFVISCHAQCGPNKDMAYPPGTTECPTGPPPGDGGGMDMGGGSSGPSFTGNGPWAAALLGDVAKTTVAGEVSASNYGGGTVAAHMINAGENIYGPMEAGFSSKQDGVLAKMGCATGKGYLPGGLDTKTTEDIVATDCNVTIPRTENGVRIAFLDACGGHTMEYHFHEKLTCLYHDATTGHSPQIGKGLDGRGLYGKYEDTATKATPLLDACGGHWGTTPAFPKDQVYHYHMQDDAPFSIGCYGPNPDNTPVTVAQCRALYTGADGCGTTATTLKTSKGDRQYDLFCPCFDGAGSNLATAITPLPIFASAFKGGPGAAYEEPAGAVDLTVPHSAALGGLGASISVSILLLTPALFL